MHVINAFEHILAHRMFQFFKYAILLFDAKDIISLFRVTAPVKLYIATLNFDCSVTIEGPQPLSSHLLNIAKIHQALHLDHAGQVSHPVPPSALVNKAA